jgi:hypothetical protein
MKTVGKLIALLVAVLISSSDAMAYKYVGSGIVDGGNTEDDGTRAAACAPATGLRQMEYNNVRALIETGGSLWQDRANSRASYIVPAEGNVSVLYAGSLWLGGTSPDQQLKLAAIRFRTEGNDFWPGPLTVDGAAEVDESVCSQYDKFFLSYKQDAQEHRRYYDCLNDPTCNLETEFVDGYAIPSYFFDYPAHGQTALGQDYYLAPFLDYDGDGFYNANAGDYPWYDFLKELPCEERRRTDPVPLFGDETYYWIFNDKGNVHSESQGEPIGMEIRAQAFTFATADEINNMTFYNYVMINQGTQTLGNTYFGTWVDADVGTATDDFVGCDVQRGLGYAYNGDAFDESSTSSDGYGENPPAVGVDFFEGPYQDEDDKDNPLTTNFAEANAEHGIPYKGIGIGYGDDIIDNERFGMRKFLYYNNSTTTNGEPSTALDYYRYLQGYWRNGQRMGYGGNALTPSSGADLSIAADYMFPGDTDPYNWGTQGVSVEDWTEISAGNPSGDRRFMQSAGPFTLEPGDYNNITVGVVYARATGGDPFESVKLVQVADDKAQALFDNCFEIVEGPDASEVTIQELDKELILLLSNDVATSNNYDETKYDLELFGFDPIIPEVVDGVPLTEAERSYQFQGYLIYQLSDAEVSTSELGDVDKARLIFQCDKQDGIKQAINYVYDQTIEEAVPTLMVDGADEGIQHSFQILNDAFATGDTKLINHRTYYFMALAYGYNNYKDYDFTSKQGQVEQFKLSRKGSSGSIRVYSGIPHNVSPEAGGTTINSGYGEGVIITRIEGRGCGNNEVDLSTETEEFIVENTFADEATYVRGRGPVNVKVIDPTRVPSSDFELRLAPDRIDLEDDTVFWQLTDLATGEVTTNTKSFYTHNEYILLDLGLSITWNQYDYINADGDEVNHFTDLLSGEIEFEDESQPWFSGIEDGEGFTELNWIRSGNQASEELEEEIIFDDEEAGNFWDIDQEYEGILGGTWAPYCLVSHSGEVTLANGQSVNIVNIAPTVSGIDGDLSSAGGDYGSNIKGLNNVDVVLTADKSKWTRAAVLEMQSIPALTQSGSNDALKMKLRRHDSVDKNGKTSSEGGNSDEANFHGQTIGMGWFPGYAIDVVTGERLNMAFGEDSWMIGDNGNDMIWNPTDRLESDLSDQLPDITTQLFAGGQHWIYVFKNQRYEENNSSLMPAYDGGDFFYDKLEENFSNLNRRRVFQACTWVGSSLVNKGYEMLTPQQGLIPNTTRIKLRVAKKYDYYSPATSDVNDTIGSQNNWAPLYTFTTKDIAAETGESETLVSIMDKINVVPNPYYAFSEYEGSKLDNRIKITNLPEECVINIYNVSGTLVRSFNKADPKTSLDWDLKNQRNVPVAGGVYIIHINIPGVGEKILKWFGVMRPVDLDSF